MGEYADESNTCRSCREGSFKCGLEDVMTSTGPAKRYRDNECDNERGYFLNSKNLCSGQKKVGQVGSRQLGKWVDCHCSCKDCDHSDGFCTACKPGFKLIDGECQHDLDFTAEWNNEDFTELKLGFSRNVRFISGGDSGEDPHDICFNYDSKKSLFNKDWRKLKPEVLQ